MSEVIATIITIIIYIVLLTLVVVGALVTLRWLWRLADVAAITYLECKIAKVKDPVRPPELMAAAWDMWSAPDFASRDHAAAIMLVGKKLRILRILPHLEILVVTHSYGDDRTKKMREFKKVLRKTYTDMKESEREEANGRSSN